MQANELRDMSRDENGSDASTLPELSKVISVSWREIQVMVKKQHSARPRAILSDISGIARPGEMMALMGPSGCGKTTLLNTLAQRQAGSIVGQVCINGREQPRSVHRAVSAYVEQEDTLIGSLTTQETLRFAADFSISRSLSKHDLVARVRDLLNEFGLQKQARTLVGTPFRKGLSGGQKRRVSVAAQLIGNPSILYLDEPTSGLDSTASHEIMLFIKRFAKQHNLVVIASIHQPSTKTFDLFDQVTLLSQGKMCYSGSRRDMPNYFAELDLEIPPMMNPAEYLLDLVNIDFAYREEAQARLDYITTQWASSALHRKLIADVLDSTSSSSDKAIHLSPGSSTRPGIRKQLFTLLRRSFIKSYRDIVTYWIRLVMYLGLAIMMGTVWLRLTTTQKHIQPFANAIFFGSAFMSFMAVAYVPAFLEDRAIFIKERANGLYGPTVFLLTNFIIGIPYLFLISTLFSVVAYWLGNFNPNAHSFFMWVLWLFLDLLAAESLVVLVASLIPNFVGALAITAFANGLWMSVGGFLVPLPVLNVFWKYAFHYWDYQTYVFQGMMVNEFSDRTYDCTVVNGQCHCMYASALQDQCKIAGTAVLEQYGYAVGKQGQWLGIMVAIILGYRLTGWVVTVLRKT
ncbi:hypothetical protein LTR62_003583 [Meristemomyces frigidus]|uniref:ABC transporter domain-containing protein n=1 Tax=Meristemomyces frigidus TaxID=1508187 RepID=A0AAN7TG35_9PEZI|nr:hypothetical protein LTR62_003583 [Meristemomyces frigidus]